MSTGGMHLTRLKVEMVSAPRGEGKQDETEKDLTKLIEGCRARVAARCPLLGAPQRISLILPGNLENPDFTCAVERRWTTAGESPARELGSLHPEAIRAAAEETKPSEPLV
jgi:hypothetical protein